MSDLSKLTIEQLVLAYRRLPRLDRNPRSIKELERHLEEARRRDARLAALEVQLAAAIAQRDTAAQALEFVGEPLGPDARATVLITAVKPMVRVPVERVRDMDAQFLNEIAIIGWMGATE